jgi:two-component system, cell cycle response regulator
MKTFDTDGATTELHNARTSEKIRQETTKKRDLRPALIFLSGELMAAPIPLERETVTIGRATEADVRVTDAQSSRLHAQIFVELDRATNEIRYRLKDLNSTNGTRLNGALINGEEILQPGDKIIIGGQIMRFELLDEIDREFQHQIHRLLAHDELTGLLTSRSFFSELRREAARAEAENRPFSVLMMDIDNFKKVNDAYGHLTGSQTLKEIGECLAGVLRAGDAAARFGGDEFTAFLLDADLEKALMAAERIRKTIERQEFPVVQIGEKYYERATHRVTASIGVAVFPADSRDALELVEMADSALYRAKNAGRNRVCVFHSGEEIRRK